MDRLIFEQRRYEKVDFTVDLLVPGDYEDCTFVQCNFSGVDCSHFNFQDCTFEACNFSLVKLVHTAFRQVRMIDCKCLGLHFELCNEFLFAIEFTNCVLHLSSFFKRSLRKSSFTRCNLQEVDFVEADLSCLILDDCDLYLAVFERTNLERTDFSSAFNYMIDPDLNRIKKARFAANGLAGLLGKYDIEIV